MDVNQWGARCLALCETGNSELDGSMMLERGINVVPTTSVGRLFDAVASIAGLAQQNRFEGQAAMLLENEIGALRTEEAYPLTGGDWAPLDLSGLMQDSRAGNARFPHRGAISQRVSELDRGSCRAGRKRSRSCSAAEFFRTAI